MSGTRVLSQGLQLMAQAPFQSSLPPQFTDAIEGDQPNDAVEVAASSPSSDFSDAARFIKQRSPLSIARDAEIHNRATDSYSHLLSPSLQADVSSSEGFSYLKINILAENAIASVPRETKLLTLPELSAIQQQIKDLEATRAEIKAQLKSNASLIEKSISGNPNSNEDTGIITTIASSNNALVSRLIDVTTEIDNKKAYLSKQYILALAFTHIDGTSSQHIEQEKKEQRINHDKQNDELLSHIASVAVQRNVMLPPPSGDTPEHKSSWAKECLNTLLQSQPNTVTDTTREVSPETSEAPDKTKEQVYKLKTALQDLQFAHTYLTKQFESERSMNTTAAETHQKKRVALENKLSETVMLLERANQRNILVEHEKNVIEAKMTELSKQNQDLQKTVTQLKIDNLGYIQESSPLSPVSDKENSPASPMTGISVSLDPTDLNPKTPLLQQNLNTKFGHSPTSPMKFNSSISVMRGEFKKMVHEIQQDYESQLEKEKNERKRLELLVKMYEDRNTEDDLL